MVPERFRAGRRLWNPEDDQLLRDLYPHLPTVDLARCLRRSLTAIFARARGLGISKSAAYLASPDACRLRRTGSEYPGRATQFRKGQVPKNKGLRRPGWGPGRMKATQFRKGQRGFNYMPVGSTRLIEGYVFRKVSDVPKVAYTVNWKPEHHLIWVAAHGPIPPGHRLRFVNGDRRDVRLDNLELVTPSAMMRRNTLHNLPKELAQTYQLLGALNRQIRKRETHAR